MTGLEPPSHLVLEAVPQPLPQSELFGDVRYLLGHVTTTTTTTPGSKTFGRYDSWLTANIRRAKIFKRRKIEADFMYHQVMAKKSTITAIK